MTNRVRMAFERRIVTLPLSAILPLRKVPDTVMKSVRYKRIATSIAEVGIIEPIVVAPPRGADARHVLLDGHVRLAVLAELGIGEARCLIACDDEAYTYNKRVNRLATIQEHFMIVRAIDRGVGEENLAKALNLDIDVIKRRRTLLEGICDEVVELLKDKTVNHITFDVLRKMKHVRQIEAAELMNLAGNFTASYAKALLAGTRQHDLVHANRPKSVNGMTSDQMARMEREMETLQRDFKAIESSYGDDVLNLVIASGYLAKMIGNGEISRYLGQHHPEILDEFRVIVAAASLDQPDTSR